MPVHVNCVAFLKGGKSINGRKKQGRELPEHTIILNRPLATVESVAQTRGKNGKTAEAISQYSGASVTFSPGWIRLEGSLESVELADAIVQDLKAGILRSWVGRSWKEVHQARACSPRCGVTALREMVDPSYRLDPLVYVQGEGFYEEQDWYANLHAMKKQDRQTAEEVMAAEGDEGWRILSLR